MDTPNKDSWRLTKAGARSVVVVSPAEVAQITKLSTGPEKERFLLGRDAVLRAKPDFVVVEGFASAARGYSQSLRIIVTAKGEADLIESLGRVQGKVAAITGAIAHTTKRRDFRGIPMLLYPRDTERLLRLVSH
jgi:molybdopterin-guanine dinucleotide biosynthesis protein